MNDDSTGTKNVTPTGGEQWGVHGSREGSRFLMTDCYALRKTLHFLKLQDPFLMIKKLD